jgi:hypothetical protein
MHEYDRSSVETLLVFLKIIVELSNFILIGQIHIVNWQSYFERYTCAIIFPMRFVNLVGWETMACLSHLEYFKVCCMALRASGNRLVISHTAVSRRTP